MRTSPVRALRALAATTALAAVLAACGSGSGGSASDDGNAGSGFEPVTIEHKFGTTEITEKPERVLTIGFNEEDFALALGVVPVGAREFLGYDAPNRPWAQEALDGATVPTVGSNEIDLEKVASLDPDLILGINSYIDQATYVLLAKIAPTVAQSDEHPDGGTPWQEQTRTTGEALGLSDEADDVVADVEREFEKAAEEHPELQGKTVGFGLGVTPTGTYALGQDDYRTGFLSDLGLTVPETGGEVPAERLDDLDADVIVVEGVESGALEAPEWQAVPAVRDDRVVDLGQFDQDFAGALGFNSPLSLPTVLEIAVPRLAAVTDDDPQTVPEPYTG